MNRPGANVSSEGLAAVPAAAGRPSASATRKARNRDIGVRLPVVALEHVDRKASYRLGCPS